MCFPVRERRERERREEIDDCATLTNMRREQRRSRRRRLGCCFQVRLFTLDHGEEALVMHVRSVDQSLQIHASLPPSLLRSRAPNICQFQSFCSWGSKALKKTQVQIYQLRQARICYTSSRFMVWSMVLSFFLSFLLSLSLFLSFLMLKWSYFPRVETAPIPRDRKHFPI